MSYGQSLQMTVNDFLIQNYLIALSKYLSITPKSIPIAFVLAKLDRGGG